MSTIRDLIFVYVFLNLVKSSFQNLGLQLKRKSRENRGFFREAGR